MAITLERNVIKLFFFCNTHLENEFYAWFDEKNEKNSISIAFPAKGNAYPSLLSLFF